MVRIILALAAALLAAAPCAAAARNTEAPYGSSKPLGIDFEARGGDDWCGREVHVALTSEDTSRLTGNSEPFQQMLGRIRAVIQGSCKEVEIIRYLGIVDGEVVSEGLAAAFNRWAYLPWSVMGNPLSCGADAETCVRRRSVFARLEKMLVGLDGGHVTLESYLSPGDGPDATFSLGKVRGTVRAVTPAARIPIRYLLPQDYLAPMFARLSKECQGTYKRQKLADLGEAVSYGTAACQMKKGRQTYFMIVKKYETDFLVIAFTDFSKRPDAGLKLAKALGTRIVLLDALGE